MTNEKPSDPKADPTFQKVVKKFLTTKPKPKVRAQKAKPSQRKGGKRG
jgi:hypothetical protein